MMADIRWKKDKKGNYISGNSWKVKATAEKARKAQPLGNSFRVTKSRKDGRYRLKLD
jgi:hypothetical protein